MSFNFPYLSTHKRVLILIFSNMHDLTYTRLATGYCVVQCSLNTCVYAVFNL
jgi:hypothetical protein